jgi:ATP-dependent DNA ligase
LWDGFRAIAHRDGDDVALMSKNGQPLGRYFPEVVDALRALPADRFSIDGELVVPIEGALSFDAIQQRVHPAASRVTMLSKKTPALFLAFDLLRLDGIELVDRPLSERRPALEAFAKQFSRGGTLRLSPATRERAVVDAWFERVGGALDGVIAKRLDVTYASGKRDGVVKIKKTRTADCVIGGYRFATGSTVKVGSLLLGLYDEAGLLDYIGFCSSFSDVQKHELVAQLELVRGGSGFTGGSPGAAPSRWSRDPERDRSYVALRPVLVLEVRFDQVTGGLFGTVRGRCAGAPIRTLWACTIDQLDVAGTVLQLID